MNKIGYHFSSAFKSIKRNFAMSISSAIAVTVTLTLVMLFLVVAININKMSNRVETSVQIYAQIDQVVAEKDYSALKAKIQKVKHVKKVRFSSKEEQKKIFLKSDLGGKEYEVMFDEGNPLSAAFYVDATQGKYVKSVSDAISKIDGITKAEYGGTSAEQMLKAFNSIRIGGGAFSLALCCLAIFLISNTIKITINARKEEIAIMRNVGASNGFIKSPFMIEGMMIGLIGSIIPILLTIFGYDYAYRAMHGVMFSSLFPMEAPVPFVYQMSLGLAILGMLVGIVGSALSVGKYLRWKR